MSVHVVQSRRDAGASAFIAGIAAAAWFFWAQVGQLSRLSPWLGIASVLALAVALAGAVLSLRRPVAESVLRERAAGRRYGLIVGIQLAVVVAGAALLARMGAVAYIPAWVCLVVGVHFFPLAPVLRDRRLILLGWVLCAVAAVAAVTGLATAARPSLVTGLGGGAAFLIFALAALAGAGRTARLAGVGRAGTPT